MRLVGSAQRATGTTGQPAEAQKEEHQRRKSLSSTLTKTRTHTKTPEGPKPQKQYRLFVGHAATESSTGSPANFTPSALSKSLSCLWKPSPKLEPPQPLRTNPGCVNSAFQSLSAPPTRRPVQPAQQRRPRPSRTTHDHPPQPAPTSFAEEEPDPPSTATTRDAAEP